MTTFHWHFPHLPGHVSRHRTHYVLLAVLMAALGITLLLVTGPSSATTSAPLKPNAQQVLPAPAKSHALETTQVPAPLATTAPASPNPAVPPRSDPPPVATKAPALTGAAKEAANNVKYVWEVINDATKGSKIGFTATQRQQPPVDTVAVDPATCPWTYMVATYQTTLNTLRYCNGTIHIVDVHKFLALPELEQQRAVISAYLHHAMEYVTTAQKGNRTVRATVGRLQGYVSKGMMANGTPEESTWVVLTENDIENPASGTAANAYNAVMDG